MWVYLVAVVLLGGVTLLVVGDVIWAVVKDSRQRNARIRAHAEEMLARYRERNRRGDVEVPNDPDQ